MIRHYQEHLRESIIDSDCICVIQSCRDDSGYMRYDIVVDTPDFFVTQRDNTDREPLGILVFLDPTTLVQKRDSDYESAISGYDKLPLRPGPHLDCYHRLVDQKCPLRGKQLHHRIEKRVLDNTAYRTFTAREVTQHYVLKRFVSLGYTGYDDGQNTYITALLDQSNHTTINNHTNKYGYTQDDILVNTSGEQLCLSLVKHI